METQNGEHTMLVEIDHLMLEEMLERAAEAGAKRALERVGLHDSDAGDDVKSLRGLLAAWRSARKSFWDTVVRSLTTAFLMALLAGLAIKIKSGGVQ